AAHTPQRGQAGVAGSDVGVRDRQHLCRRGTVACSGALGPPHGTYQRRQGQGGTVRITRGHGGGAGSGWDLVRRAVCECQRPVGILRAFTGRLRPDGGAVPSLSWADSPRGVRQPLCLFLPPLPTSTPVTGVRAPHAAVVTAVVSADAVGTVAG